MVYNGKPTREWLSKEDSMFPMASNEGIFLQAKIDAYENRDIMVNDVPNTFIQSLIELKPGQERVIMTIVGILVDIPVEKNPARYKDYVVYENGKKVLYVELLKALYGMLSASLMLYKKFRKDLEDYGFTFNDYDPCVVNKVVNGKMLTIRYHVDDIMSSHVDSKVNDEFLMWLNKMY